MKKKIIIDGDPLLHTAYSVVMKPDDLGGEDISDPTDDLRAMKTIVKQQITELEDIAQIESIANTWTTGKTKVVFSDPNGNFRYDIYPEYKAGRPEKTEIFKQLRKWAHKKIGYFVEGTEADDVVSHYMRKGHLTFTLDKDIIYGNAGTAFNTHAQHRSWVYQTEEAALHFFKCQILAGDRVDGIPSIKGVAFKTAEKLMKEHGNEFEDLLKIFELKGHDRDYMLTMARLVAMNQWHPKKGVRLWKFPKSK